MEVSKEPTLEQLIRALQSSWVADTAFDENDWSKDNPARGQCVVSSLVVQDYFGGELVRYRVTTDALDEMHYCNKLEDGTILDTTGSQYQMPVTMTVLPVDLKDFASIREKRLADADTKKRYEILKARVASILA